MLVTLNHPYKDMYGGIGTHYYIRRSPTGKFIIQSKPRKASKKQQEMRKKFIEKNKGNLWRSYVHPPKCYRREREEEGRKGGEAERQKGSSQPISLSAYQPISLSAPKHQTQITKPTNNMKAMLKCELADRMGIGRTTMAKYMRQIEDRLPHYKRRQALLSPDQVKVVCDYYCITLTA